MSEVEAVCGRVILIARGRIAIDDRLDHLRTDAAIVIQARGRRHQSDVRHGAAKGS